MKRTYREMKLTASVAIVSAAIGWTLTADAHAFPSSEEPKVGSTINQPPAEVAIKFDNPIEQVFARLQVLDQSGGDESAGPPTLDPDRHQLSVKLKVLAQGDFTVKWSVVAEDGHRTQGSYVFTVAPAKP